MKEGGNTLQKIMVASRPAFYLAAFVSLASAACNNQCSGHGDCGSDSNCACYSNWMGPDCSERVCGYTKAFINAPTTGDVNGDGHINMLLNKQEDDGRWMTEAYNIEYGLGRGLLDGTTESLKWDEGHFYAECGNVGICDRETGICNCFPGFSGSSCQRTACPGQIDGETLRDTVVCSGYGRCVPAYDSLSIDYKLWDARATTKCECDHHYTGIDCSLRKCPHGIDPVGSANHVRNRVQKISFPAFDIELDSVTAPWGDFRARINGEVLFTLTETDVYGDEWTTTVNTLKYITTCSDTAGKSCTVRPWFDQDLLDAYAGDSSVLNGERLVADQVNETLQALPSESFPYGDTYAWMDYPLQSFQYPSETYSTETTLYFNSPFTRFPDFTLAEAVDCGGALDYVSITGVTNAVEGFCMFVRSPYLTSEESVLTVRYMYQDGITDLSSISDPSEASKGLQHDGTSSTLTRDETTLVTSVSTLGSGLIGTDWPFVTVEEVGKFRYWDPAIDGKPAMLFLPPEVGECSNRGMCNTDTLVDQGIVQLSL